MIRKPKILYKVLFVLLVMGFSCSVATSQQIAPPKGGWDCVKPASQIDIQIEDRIPEKVYPTGDIEDGVLKISHNIQFFPSTRLITMDLVDADIKTVLQVIAEQGGKNIVIDESVPNKAMTADLKKVPINTAMDLILATGELEARIVDNTLFIASRSTMPIKGLNRRYVKSFKLNYSEPLEVADIVAASIFNRGFDVTTERSEQLAQPTAEDGVAQQAMETYQEPPPDLVDAGGTRINTGERPLGQQGQLNFGGAPQSPLSAATTAGSGSVQTSNIREIRTRQKIIESGQYFNDASRLASEIRIQGIKEQVGRYNVANNSGGPIVVPDERTNTVLVVGQEQDILIAEKTIQALDKPLKQVSIEVSLIEMSRNDALEWGFAIEGGANIFSSAFSSSQISPGTATYPEASLLVETDPGFGIVQLSTLQNVTNEVIGQLRARMTRNQIKILANPNVIALDGAQSLIKLTEQIVNQITVTTTQTTVTESTELEEVGIVLYVTPRVTNDGYISLSIRPSITSPGDTYVSALTGSVTRLITTREVLIQEARVKSGETLAIGGLVSNTSTRTEDKVPILGDLPIVGGLFRQANNSKEKTELVILLTPKIIDDNATQDLKKATFVAPID